MARLTVVRSVIIGFGLALIAAQGCSKQGEGDRCEPNAARNADCDDGLVCVPNAELLNGITTADDFGRCCPEDRTSYSDSRCAPRSAGMDSDSGAGATSGEGGSAGAASGESGSGGQPAAAGGEGGEPQTNGGSGGDGTSAGAGAGGVSSGGGQGGQAGAGGA